METSIVSAWLVGEGIIFYRAVKKQTKGQKHLPPPGQVLAVSGLFALCGLLSEFQPGLASLLAWGLDIAALMNLAPSITGGATGTAGAGVGTVAGAVAK